LFIAMLLLCYSSVFKSIGFKGMSLKRLLYTLFLYLVFPVILLRLLLKSRNNSGYRKRLSERLGLVEAIDKKPVIWVHAVSVGEAIASKPLVEALLHDYPNIPVLLTTTTPTGSDRVQAMFANKIRQHQLLHTYFPYDLLGSVSRFINNLNPKILIVVETEIWPNLYAKCYQKNIPVVMVNARLSEKSTQSYLKVRGLIAETLSKVSVIAVRSKSDAIRFSNLGADKRQIKEIGNIKYDISRDGVQVLKSEELLKTINTNVLNKRLVYVAASTHKGEEYKILFTYQNLLKQFPELLLILVPRHPERFDEVYDECIKQLPKELNILRRSQNQSFSQFKDVKIDVLLGDSMGEMQMWFAAADVVFIGGSLVETGGHNPLEVTLFGVPVVSGPHMFNFEDITDELSSAELLIICNDEFDVVNKINQILIGGKNKFLGESLQNEYINKANDFMQQHQGVTARLSKIISSSLN
jgi:3-deoxy-D-manno-octulosonic-acid transferase